MPKVSAAVIVSIFLLLSIVILQMFHGSESRATLGEMISTQAENVQ